VPNCLPTFFSLAHFHANFSEDFRMAMTDRKQTFVEGRKTRLEEASLICVGKVRPGRE
jgi:hypothetical protein